MAVPGWGFNEWTGAINTSDNPAAIEIDSDQSVTAVFYQNTLTVTSGGQGPVSTGGDPQTPMCSPRTSNRASRSR